jgi:hypothetical protein
VGCLIKKYPHNTARSALETKLAVSKIANPSPYQIAYYLSNLDHDGVIFSSSFSDVFVNRVAREPSSSSIHQYAHLALNYLKNDYAINHSISDDRANARLDDLEKSCSECTAPHSIPFSKEPRYKCQLSYIPRPCKQDSCVESHLECSGEALHRQISESPEAADLLISLFYAAASAGQNVVYTLQQDAYPKWLGVNATVAAPEILKLLKKLPSVDEMIAIFECELDMQCK